MKFKPINRENGLLETTRYNKNVVGKHISVSHSFGSQDKRNYAALCMLGIMSKTEDFDRIVESNKEAKFVDIMNRMIDNASLIVDKTFLKDDGKKVL